MTTKKPTRSRSTNPTAPAKRVKAKTGDADTVNPRLSNSVMFPKAKAKAKAKTKTKTKAKARY